MKRESKLNGSKQKSFVIKLDGIGFTVSTLCAVHCALLPFVFTFLPLMGLEFLAESWVEVSMVIFSISIGMFSLIPSYRKYHHNKKPLVFLTIGFLLIFGTHFLGFHEFEPILVSIGGLCIAVAHYSNWKLSKPYHCYQCT